MREYTSGKKFRKKLAKLYKKDKRRYEALMGKIEELLACEDPEHYKNLRAPLQHLKEVHFNSHFVLTFKYLKNEDLIELIDFDHHDKISK
jgi:mRNA-degrading endonuclease RelE of RelBE toxin-antitoxin system